MAIVATGEMAVTPDLKGFESKMNSSIGGIAKKAALAFGGAFAATKAVDFLGSSIADARESNKVAAQTAAAIKSTGGAAGVTAKQVDQLAGAISRKTGIDDEAIAKASNLLLTFTNIKNAAGENNDIFNQATKITADMGAALGTDAAGAAIQLGKALNDPIKGLVGLGRAGVQFNETQKEQIKNFVEAGDLASAQKVILAELNKEFGGSAEAQATAADKLKVTFGNLKEDLGNKLIPVLDKVATFIADNLPAALEFGGRAFGFIRDAVARVTTALRPFIEENLPKVIAAVQDVVAFVQENMPKFQEAFEHVVNAIKVAFEVIAPIVQGAIDLIVPIIQRIVDTIKNVVLLVTNIINGDFSAAFGNLKKIVGNVVGAAIDIIKGIGPKILESLGRLGSLLLGAGADLIKGLVKGIKDKAGDVIDAIKKFVLDKVPGFVKRFFGIKSPSTMFAGFGESMMAGLAAGISSNARMPLGALAAMSNQLGVGKVGFAAASGVTSSAVGGVTDNRRYGGNTTVNVYEVHADPRATAFRVATMLGAEATR